MLILETPRLSLRRFTSDDAPFILRLLNDPAFVLHIADKGVRTVEDARAYLASGPLAHYGRHGFGLWLVSERASGVPIGMCGLIKRDTLEDIDSRRGGVTTRARRRGGRGPAAHVAVERVSGAVPALRS